MLHEGNNDSRISIYPEVLVRGQIKRFSLQQYMKVAPKRLSVSAAFKPLCLSKHLGSSKSHPGCPNPPSALQNTEEDIRHVMQFDGCFMRGIMIQGLVFIQRF